VVEGRRLREKRVKKKGGKRRKEGVVKGVEE